MTKNLFDISWQVDEPTYRADSAYSQSTLGKFERTGVEGLESLNERISTDALRIGSAVDTILTGSEEEFQGAFYVTTTNPQIIEIVKTLHAMFGDTYATFESIPSEVLCPEILNTDFRTRWNPDTRLKAFFERNPGDYYNNMRYLQDKTVITDKQYELVKRMITAVREHPQISRLFAPNNPFNNDYVREYQLKFKDTFRGINYRGMADLIITDHVNKVVHPYDLKTSGKPETEFPKSFVEYGYSTQARLYWRLIRNAMDRDELFRTYKLDNFVFIVVSKTPNPCPLLWEYKDTQKTGTVVYGSKNQFIFEDPYVLGERLYYYQNIYPELLPGVNKDGVNDIVEWLKDY